MERREFLTASGKIALLGGVASLAYAGHACSKNDGKKLRVGVVGGNFGSRFFFHEHPQCEVTAVTDLIPDRREHLQKVYSCSNAYDSFEEMVKKARNIDAVAIFSEATHHVKHTLMALDCGWHVLCACPACETLEQAEQLRESVEKSGLLYMQAESSWYRPGCIYARNLQKKGAFGELFYTEAEYYHDRGNLDALLTNKSTRFWTDQGAPSWRRGYPPLGYPTHATAFLVGVTGEQVTHVSALGWGTKHPFLTSNRYSNPFWNETSLMRTNRGHMLRANVFWLVAGEGERAQWSGSEGSLWMANPGHNPDLFQARDKSASAVSLPSYSTSDMLPEAMRHPSHHGDSATFLTAEFINAILQKRKPEIDLYRSLAMTVPGLVGHQSALKNGEQLPVPQYPIS